MQLAPLIERINLYEKLMRLDKPIGILLLLWPTLWGLWIASAGLPNLMLLWIFVFGTVLMRSAGCVINDYADRDFDPHVAPTPTFRWAALLRSPFAIHPRLLPARPASNVSPRAAASAARRNQR